MAGTLTVGTLSDGTNSTSATNAIQGSAKAWLNYNISGSSTRSSFNISSVSKASTGVFTFSLTTALSDSSGCVSGTGSASGTTAARSVMTVEANLPTSSSFPMYCLNDNGNASDATFACMSVNR